MSLFQKSVINKYLKNLDNNKVDKAYENFQKFYGNKLRLANIMQLKEENYQEGFLREIFVHALGYTINPDENYNLTTEYKNQKDSRKADGAIVTRGHVTRGHVARGHVARGHVARGHVPLTKKAIGVIELKSTKTKNLESIKEQAFGYKNNQPDCKYVITSNFQSLRFYVDNANEYEEFNLFRLNKKQFKLLYLLLSKESIFSDLPAKLKQETKFHENDISNKLYEDYKRFKDRIFENLVKNNPKYEKLTLFKKSQKLLDRFLFVFFAEDSGLIPPNTISKIIEQWKQLQELDEYKTLYSRFQKLFLHLDKGHNYKKWDKIPAYNGGLFRKDEILDSTSIKIDDAVLEKDSLKLSAYDFNTEVDVNILGHIFEHSLNEIEEITAELSATAATRKHVSLRKKDGVFYTPKYITKYIVENTVGTLCNEKKAELQINNLLIDDSLFRTATTKGHVPLSNKGKKLFDKLNNYKDWLLTLKILDPACGSGAFLNQTLDFLINEHKQTDDLLAELTGDNLRLFDTDKAILENNIYGVDINEESVEIAKLSLWLRTAQRGRQLSDLSSNIKCGNSLIDDPEVAGDKAFDWHKEFPQVFKTKQKQLIKKEIEEKPDYLSLIEQNAKLAKEKAEKSVELSKEAFEYSKKVYEFAQKQKLLVDESEVLYGIDKGGFDVVLGNPPYFNIQTLGKGSPISNLLKNEYSEIYQDKSDILFYFIKKALDISKINVSFIISNAFLFSNKAQKLRNWLIDNADIIRIINFEQYMVFKDASITSLIITIRKGKYSGKTEIINFTEKHLNADIIENRIINKTSYYEVTFEKDKVWALIKRDLASLHQKIDNNYSRLEDIFLIGKGMETAADKIFTFNKIPTGFPLSYFKKRVTGLNIKRYSISFDADFLLYFENVENFNDLDLSVQKHLLNNKSILENRADKKRRSTSKWWNYTFAMHKEYYHLPKLICSRRASDNTFVYDDSFNYLPFSNMTVIFDTNPNVSIKYVLCILNSKLLNFRYKGIAKQTGSGVFEYFPNSIGRIPIKEILKENQQSFIENADLMLSLNKELQKEKDNLLNTLKEEKGIEKITKKLNVFYDFEYDILKKELTKQKVKFSLGNENNEWREYFTTSKQEINDLQQKINQTDKEIDKMVYELYELTTEEIEIVEKMV